MVKEMLALLTQHCCPDTVANTFASLLSLFNDLQGELESILEYHSRFDGLTLELSQCKVVIPPLLLVMIFLWAIHSYYADIVEQFYSQFKTIKTETVDSIVSNVALHDSFTLVDSKKGESARDSGSNLCVPATATAHLLSRSSMEVSL
jgi:hypothetical protein